LSIVYLIRHGQAGSRDNYDVLSDLGGQQGSRLGEYFLGEGIRFDAVYSGSMTRQRLTAELVCATCLQGGAPVPDIATDPGWNEFSLAAVYRGISSRMIEENSEFASDFDEMQEALRQDPHITRGAAGRCDLAVMRAWVQNRYPDYDGESWVAFKSRVLSQISKLTAHAPEEVVAVFTSATPISILTGAALSAPEEKVVGLAGAVSNSSITVLRAQEEDLRLFSFNATPHLPSSLRTFR
jgi:broad specificity phosphatase PhoE